MKYSLTALVFVAATLPTSPAHAACNVTVSFPNFSPATYTVQAGGSVTWCWAEGGHSVEGSFGDSGVRIAGAEYPVTFSTPGTYEYQCGVHDSMQASIVVQGSQPSPTKTASPTPKPTTTSPTPTPLRTTPAAALTTPPTRFPTPTPTTAAPTTTPPATTTTPPATTSAPTTPSTTPAAVEIDPAPAKPKTGLAIALGLLVAVGAIGGAAWLLLRGRTG